MWPFHVFVVLFFQSEKAKHGIELFRRVKNLIVFAFPAFALSVCEIIKGQKAASGFHQNRY